MNKHKVSLGMWREVRYLLKGRLVYCQQKCHKGLLSKLS